MTSSTSSFSSSATIEGLSWMVFSATLSAAITVIVTQYFNFSPWTNSITTNVDDDIDDIDRTTKLENTRRKRLPSLVILVRHGESEGNVNKSVWCQKADNLIQLTPKGIQQAIDAGKRIETIYKRHEQTCNDNIDRVHMHVSPFQRTIQTARYARQAFLHRVVRQDLCPRIREQEFGNVQKDHDEQLRLRNEQQRVGRFWYRFPTGESGADVYDRVTSFWYDTLLSVNDRVGYDPVDAVVVICHGLTLRCILMQLFSWSPTTFHSVYNARNCEMYVLKKDLSKPGISPYVLDTTRNGGDLPRSSIDIHVRLKPSKTTKSVNVGSSLEDKDRIVDIKDVERIEKVFKLHDYLNIPPPRMTQIDIVKQRLVEQYPTEINSVDSIESLTFMPFYYHNNNQNDSDDITSDSKDKNGYRRDSHANTTTPPSGEVQGRTSVAVHNVEDDKIADNDKHDDDVPLPGTKTRKRHHARPESSHRWPCVYD